MALNIQLSSKSFGIAKMRGTEILDIWWDDKHGVL